MILLQIYLMWHFDSLDYIHGRVAAAGSHNVFRFTPPQKCVDIESSGLASMKLEAHPSKAAEVRLWGKPGLLL